jgi:transposase
MKTFKPYNPDQLFLLPPALRDWLPEGHLALFLSDVVETALDLTAILATYETGDGRGQPPYHPALLVRLLHYGYCTGKPSSRVIERATYEEIPYRVLAANQHPDHDTLAAFRQTHLAALAGLFLQVLHLCQRAGLVMLGYVALDGTRGECLQAQGDELRPDARTPSASWNRRSPPSWPKRSESIPPRTPSTARAGAGPQSPANVGASAVDPSNDCCGGRGVDSTRRASQHPAGVDHRRRHRS